jgi:hypothetical protein
MKTLSIAFQSEWAFAIAHRISRLTLSLVIACWSVWAWSQTQTAVEYYYAAWDYYFVTTFPDEIAALDSGAFGGVWKRTGESFTVWIDPTPGAFATCRFFSTSFAPKSSHFYTPFASECATVKGNRDWQFEAIAFDLQLPDAAGTCPAGTSVLYRLYNNGAGGAPNHRFTASSTTFDRMRVAAWTFEGNGVTGAFACVPMNAAHGVWQGKTATGDDALILAFENGTFYFVSVGSTNVEIAQGTASANDGVFKSSDARASVYPFQGVKNASIVGAYVPKKSFNGTITSVAGDVSFTTTYDAEEDQPATLANVAGTYTGDLTTPGLVQAIGTAILTITPSGVVSGSAVGCSIKGTASPHGSSPGFDLLLEFDGNGCLLNALAAGADWGIAISDGDTGLIAIVQTPSRNDGCVFIGYK